MQITDSDAPPWTEDELKKAKMIVALHDRIETPKRVRAELGEALEGAEGDSHEAALFLKNIRARGVPDSNEGLFVLLEALTETVTSLEGAIEWVRLALSCVASLHEEEEEDEDG